MKHYKTLLGLALIGGALMSSCSNDDEKKEYETVGGDVQAACDAWKSARQYWEWSEAFLFGPASDYAIDPHIDTWPVDQTTLAGILTDESLMGDIDNKISQQDDGVLGFHGIEYVLFRSGAARDNSQVTRVEYEYARAVSRDLYKCASVLQACWAGKENISAERQALVDAFFSAHNGEYENYGKAFVDYGEGKLYETALDATIQILEGARDIIGEVQSGKIGKPFTGEDANYIESPYAYNSIQDFYDNIEGCKFAFYGKLGAMSPQENSVIKTCQGWTEVSPYANEVVAALDKSLEKIQSMKAPFAIYFTDPGVKAAMDALKELDDKVGELETQLMKYKGNNSVLEALVKVNANYVSNVVVPTYAALADKSAELQGKINGIAN